VGVVGKVLALVQVEVLVLLLLLLVHHHQKLLGLHLQTFHLEQLGRIHQVNLIRLRLGLEGPHHQVDHLGLVQLS